MQEYPESTSKKLLNMTRVLLPAGGITLFEDEEGNLNPKVRSALVYNVEVS